MIVWLLLIMNPSTGRLEPIPLVYESLTECRQSAEESKYEFPQLDFFCRKAMIVKKSN